VLLAGCDCIRVGAEGVGNPATATDADLPTRDRNALHVRRQLHPDGRAMPSRAARQSDGALGCYLPLPAGEHNSTEFS
jgi:hypothetical protein